MPVNMNLKDIVATGVLGTLNPNALAQEEAMREAAFRQTREIANPQVQESPQFLGRASTSLGVPVKNLQPKVESVRDVVDKEGTEGLSRLLTTPGRLVMKQDDMGNPQWGFISWPAGPSPGAHQMIGRAETLKRIPFIEQNEDLAKYLNSVAMGKVEDLTPEQKFAERDKRAEALVKSYPGLNISQTKFDLAKSMGIEPTDQDYDELAKYRLTKAGMPVTTGYLEDEKRQLRNEQAMPEQQARNKFRMATLAANTLLNKGMIKPEQVNDVVLMGMGFGDLVRGNDPVKASRRLDLLMKQKAALEQGLNYIRDPETGAILNFMQEKPGTSEYSLAAQTYSQQLENEIFILAKGMKDKGVDEAYWGAAKPYIDKYEQTKAKEEIKTNLSQDVYIRFMTIAASNLGLNFANRAAWTKDQHNQVKDLTNQLIDKNIEQGKLGKSTPKKEQKGQ